MLTRGLTSARVSPNAGALVVCCAADVRGSADTTWSLLLRAAAASTASAFASIAAARALRRLLRSVTEFAGADIIRFAASALAGVRCLVVKGLSSVVRVGTAVPPMPMVDMGGDSNVFLSFERPKEF